MEIHYILDENNSVLKSFTDETDDDIYNSFIDLQKENKGIFLVKRMKFVRNTKRETKYGIIDDI